MRIDPGSFRDPSGHVYHDGGRVLRTIGERAAEDYRFLRDGGLMERLAAEGLLLPAKEVEGAKELRAAHVVEHPRIPFVSFPYEWSFAALRAAALLHLDLHLAALEGGATLIDASAYNVQFRGAEPVFIDLLSLRRYREGDYWLGHRQFCEQFLNPLLLGAALGVPHNAWYRGALEGLPSAEVARLLPLSWRWRWTVLSNVVLPARLQRSTGTREAASRKARRGLPLPALRGMLHGLRRFIAGLEPPGTDRGSAWADYAGNNSYPDEAAEAKRRAVAEFVAARRPAILWDLGCNTGDYTKAALDAGADSAIGFDLDPATVDKAFGRARREGLNFLPLVMDAANPTPDQGFAQAERPGLLRRRNADALIALAFLHHLVIGRNVPMDRAVDWLTGLAPAGLIEFVPPDDPMVRLMLALRDESVFADYGEESFAVALGARARIVSRARLPGSGRVLFHYERGS